MIVFWRRPMSLMIGQVLGVITIFELNGTNGRKLQRHLLDG